MPDLRPVNRYMATLEHIETQTATVARRAIASARADLLAILTEWDPRRPIQRAVYTAPITTVAQITATALRDVMPRIATAAAALVEAQTGETISGQLEVVSSAPSAAYDWELAATGQLLAEVQYLALTGANEAEAVGRLVRGTDGRAAVLQIVATALVLTIGRAVWGSGNGTVLQLARRARRAYQKQAIAQIDRRTSQICLNVHGQIRELDEPFDTLAGPAQAPPFHGNCRTAISLYLPEMEQISPTTNELRAAAREARRARHG